MARGARTGRRQAADFESVDAQADSWWSAGRVAAVRLDRDVPIAELADGSLTRDALLATGASRADLAGWWHDEVWDYLRYLPAAVTDDINRMRALPVPGLTYRRMDRSRNTRPCWGRMP